jgi:hypothetical protein
VVTIFDQGCQAIVGRSLKQERPDIFQYLAELSTYRNDVAHRGIISANVTRESVVERLEAVQAALDWLFGLKSSP